MLIGVPDNVLLCSQLPPINGEGRRGVHNWGIFFINFILVSEHIDHY